MRGLLLAIGLSLFSTCLFAQKKIEFDDLSLLRRELDSIDYAQDSTSIATLSLRIEEQVRSITPSKFNDCIQIIANTTNESSTPERHYRFLSTALATFHEGNLGRRNFDQIYQAIQRIAPPASTLCNAIIDLWQCQSFERAKDFPNAIKFAKSSLQGHIALNAHGDACNGFTLVGILYTKAKLWKESVIWHKKGLDYALKHQIPIWISLTSGNLGNALLQVKDTIQALKYLTIDLETGTKLKAYSSIANTWTLLARIAKKRGQYSKWKSGLDSASYYAQLAFPYGGNHERTWYEIYFEWSDWHRYIGNYQEAMKYQSLFYESKHRHDSLEEKRFSTELFNLLEKKYRDKEMSLLQSDLEQKASLNKLYGVLLFVMVVFLGTLSYFIYNLRKKTKLEQESNARLESLNQLKDRMFSVISHDLRSPLASLSGLIELFNQDDLSEQEKSYFLEEVKTQLGATMTLLDNLLQWSMLQFKGESLPKPVNLPIAEEVKQILTLLQGQAKRKHIQLTSTIPIELSATFDPNHFQLILRNLISNAIKFSHPNSMVQISAKKKDSIVEIEVRDTGVGIPEEAMHSLFKRNSYHSTFGTSGEKGAGLGLSLCYDYAVLNAGKLEASSQEGKGSTFCLSLPAS